MSSVDTPGGDGFPEELGGGAVASDGAVLPPPVEMQQEEGLALREWCWKNAIRLEEKEMKEKESLKKIVEAADEYKIEFDRKWKAKCMNNSTRKRESEFSFYCFLNVLSYLESQEKFHAEASNNYFKATSELIPNEVPKKEKRGKKLEEKNPSVVVIQGPKPGKPIDLSRMRQILVKLKHDVPAHMKPPPQPEDDNKTSLVPPTKPVSVTGS